jgi:opacity protein-like surface antigen
LGEPTKGGPLRKLLITAVLAVALVLPAQAAAKTKHYVGAVSPSGSISFNVVKKKKGKKTKPQVKGFSFAGIPVNCEDGAHTTHGFVSFPVKLRGGNFNIVASSSVTGATLEVHGNLAAGTIHVAGNVPIDPSGTGSNCDSGVLNWTAQRG